MKIRVAVLLVLSLTALASAADEVLVEDWSKLKVGAKGVPDGWKAQNWGSPAFDFSIVDDSGTRALNLKSRNEGSTIIRDIKGKVDLKETPILEWKWKMIALPKNGNSCAKATDDQAGQVFVAWPRFPEAVRSRIVGYVWDTTQPAGHMCKSEKTGTVTYIVVRSGSADLGKWFTERRNVRDDFRKIYGEEPDPPGAVSLAIDSNDTNSTAEALIGPVVFRRQ
jgi:hypothetical protein